ncbi:inorganic phosphate transporter [Thiomicrospira pelophila]|uniref:inorganic phosphate transporter n=1 Tax=Thiomicrospira pelophila TaxID=934 RepID=UPI0004A70580|nr:inorganic phosphate transporter [Thiomicrospira pelophila]
MELKNIQTIEEASKRSRSELFRFGLALLFIVGVILFTYVNYGHISITLVIAAMIGGYMAMNIGANDVANNVGPAVGSKAMTLTTAIAIAAIFEAAGAIIAGGSVVTTIKGGIISPDDIADAQTFVWLMMAALLAAALWLNLATALGAPVSTTHSIIGGVLGGGIAAAGWAIVNWETVGQIAASWVISPLLGGSIAAILLYVIKRTITYKADMMDASRRMVPWLLALMGWAFGTYLMMKGLKKVMPVSFIGAVGIGVVVALIVYFITRPIVDRASKVNANSKDGVNKMFTIPLIFAAALLSFAHGSNDVANAVGPLAAINDALLGSEIHGKAAIPLWIMLVGALGIAIGLALYGPKLIRTVGTEITDIDQMRAYSIAMAAAITVILASQLGLPVSTTHVTIGAIFGVGFLREYLKANYKRMIQKIEDHHKGKDRAIVEAFIRRFDKASLAEKGRMLQDLKNDALDNNAHLTKKERKGLKKVYREELVKRSIMLKVIAAWVITVPATALISAGVFYSIQLVMTS